ncbi:C-type lectin domain family 10 member A-like [Sander lucioperca]|uniref:C-type lectin domain family 10 member A-like n=1 Tax=Sander lucioperca TaxID=283035 RepID=UPI001653B71E|nr:C-type lectin domain family 10 member A-like [Sander lucioperca]
MDDIYINVEYNKSVDPRPSTNQTGPRSSERRFPGAVVLCLGLLSVFLLAGIIGLGVHYHVTLRGSAAELSTIKANLTERLQASDNKSSSLTEERDRLNSSLTEMTKMLDRLKQKLSTIKANLTERLQASDDLDRLKQKLSTIKANLTECLQASDNKLSSLTEERDRLNSSLTEMTKMLDRLQQSGSAADLSTIKANLTECLQASDNKLSSLTEERDRLNSRLTEMAKELDRLQQNKTCPAEWRMFSSSCYLLSAESGSWEKGRQYCRDRGADLMVIDSSEEQTFLSKFIKQNARYWIGLTDRDEEGTWKWVDGTPLTLKNWRRGQPDNGGGDPQWGEEDCAHIGPYTAEWNDRSCISVMYWICEKKA